MTLGFLTHSAQGLRFLSHTPPAVSSWPTATSAVCRVSAHIIFTHKAIHNFYTQTSSRFYMLHLLLMHYSCSCSNALCVPLHQISYYVAFHNAFAFLFKLCISFLDFWFNELHLNTKFITALCLFVEIWPV